MQTMTMLQDRPGERTPTTVLRSTELEKTQLQVATLLSICDLNSRFLLKVPEVGQTFEVHPRAEEEAAKTFELAQLQLRNLIDDPARWTLTPNKSDELVLDLIELNKEVLHRERERVEQMKRPSVLYSPKLRLLQADGIARWVAWLGESATPLPGMAVGLGDSPEHALASFDEAMRARVAASLPPLPSDSGAGEPESKPRKGKRRAE